MAIAKPRASYDATIADQIQRLQDAKADLKTAIENKGVTVPSNTKLDGYADLVDSIEQGSPVPYIVNPLNGGQLGLPSGGTYTHQYQISSGTIVECDLFCYYQSLGGGSVVIYPDSVISPNNKYYLYYAHDKHYTELTNTGLLTVVVPVGGGGSNGYDVYWNMECLIKTDNGYILRDSFRYPAWYTCFIKGTRISLANGEKINIEDVNYDTELLVWNFDEGKYDSAKPLWIKKVQTTTWYYKLKFSNGLELKVTGTYPEAHSLFSVEEGRFIHANKLVGKKVYTLDGIAALESCEEVHENVEFYNIITKYHMNLFADNVLTSTSLNNLYPIKDMKFVKEDREPVFDYTQFSDDWIVGARLKEQPTDVTKYCLDHIKLTK